MSVSARERCQRVGCRHPESSHEPASRDQRDKLPTVCRDASGDDLDDCLCAEFVPKHAAPGGDGDPSREQDTRPIKINAINFRPSAATPPETISTIVSVRSLYRSTPRPAAMVTRRVSKTRDPPRSTR